jgi:hypothetical protein
MTMTMTMTHDAMAMLGPCYDYAMTMTMTMAHDAMPMLCPGAADAGPVEYG